MGASSNVWRFLLGTVIRIFFFFKLQIVPGGRSTSALFGVWYVWKMREGHKWGSVQYGGVG